jgi:pimeloyl-ACP methyl ester carboxylesterase
MEHPQSPEKAIVLIHGLRDSPYFMTAVGHYFFEKLGYNVYLPLLHCHGLREPKGMEGVKLDEWKANVNFAVDVAKSKAVQVSIGGLSTGGALSFYTAVKHPAITGTLYLFSAALDLAGGPAGVAGEATERILRIPPILGVTISDLFDSAKALISDDECYRYTRVDIDGVRELAKLIEENDDLINKFDPKNPFSKRVFAAHSESDLTADISGIERLQEVSDRNRFKFCRIPKAMGVSHVSLVLKEPLEVTDNSGRTKRLEEANPEFQAMMEAIGEWDESA